MVDRHIGLFDGGISVYEELEDAVSEYVFRRCDVLFLQCIVEARPSPYFNLWWQLDRLSRASD